MIDNKSPLTRERRFGILVKTKQCDKIGRCLTPYPGKKRLHLVYILWITIVRLTVNTGSTENKRSSVFEEYLDDSHYKDHVVINSNTPAQPYMGVPNPPWNRSCRCSNDWPPRFAEKTPHRGQVPTAQAGRHLQQRCSPLHGCTHE